MTLLLVFHYIHPFVNRTKKIVNHFILNSNFTSQTSNLKLQISNLKPKTSHFKPQLLLLLSSLSSILYFVCSLSTPTSTSDLNLHFNVHPNLDINPSLFFLFRSIRRIKYSHWKLYMYGDTSHCSYFVYVHSYSFSYPHPYPHLYSSYPSSMRGSSPEFPERR